MAIAYSCGTTPPAATVASAAGSLDNAEALVDADDMRSAQSLADDIRAQLTPDAVSADPAGAATALGRLAIIYMRMADDADASADHVATAYQCYTASFASDSVAAQAFYATLPIEHMRHAALLNSLSHAADHLSDPVDSEPDSIYMLPSDPEQTAP